LEQTFNLGAGNPNTHFRKLNEVGDCWSVNVNEAQGVSDDLRNRLLSWGVPSEGEGRAAYLRTSYARLPQNRGKMAPATSNQDYGFNIKCGLPGQTLPLSQARQQKSAVKHFFAKTPLTSYAGKGRSPDQGNLRDDAVYVERFD
jgi:hypothetical protein